MNIWAVLSDEQMRKRWPFSLLNDEQMSNKVGVEHQPDMYLYITFLGGGGIIFPIMLNFRGVLYLLIFIVCIEYYVYTCTYMLFG